MSSTAYVSYQFRLRDWTRHHLPAQISYILVFLEEQFPTSTRQASSQIWWERQRLDQTSRSKLESHHLKILTSNRNLLSQELIEGSQSCLRDYKKEIEMLR